MSSAHINTESILNLLQNNYGDTAWVVYVIHHEDEKQYSEGYYVTNEPLKFVEDLLGTKILPDQNDINRTIDRFRNLSDDDLSETLYVSYYYPITRDGLYEELDKMVLFVGGLTTKIINVGSSQDEDIYLNITFPSVVHAELFYNNVREELGNYINNLNVLDERDPLYQRILDA